MKYMGSKRRIAKHILPIILKNRKPGQWYVEPFVGGANLIDKVECPRIGADSNPYLIEALKLIRDTPESLPDHVSEEEYGRLKEKKELNGLTGFVGFSCSFGGKWFRGYARDPKGGQNFSKNAKNNAINQSPLLKNILFIPVHYQFLDIPPKSIIYCDPPYVGTERYKDAFDSVAFWDWARTKSREGHQVFVSEYTAPEDFSSIWEGEISSSLSNMKNKKVTEKLFIFNDLY